MSELSQTTQVFGADGIARVPEAHSGGARERLTVEFLPRSATTPEGEAAIWVSKLPHAVEFASQSVRRWATAAVRRPRHRRWGHGA